ncbi:Vacuolar-sorting receptor 1 [Seminavis robusta]|uniref:Vacuolar-sorting receptor 1 n=1 Tax=Seminavis robusta TaxID=568900 RepID=A0A9N8DYB4_9STRA|nr:Vacuolar-sorting receptor 1 [Seminavis robusta]|eukprot:Sro364_g127280.1 Vacuolar-sorting receptor 1 (373) ;mRNA; r:72127-73362
MFKHDADKVKDELAKNRPVRLEMQWSLPHPDSRVEYDLFSSPTDPVAHHFLNEFKPIAKALGHHAYFTPHIILFFTQSNRTNSDLLRYCAMDPDKNLDSGVSGFDVVKESLRRHCIWSNYGEDDGVGEKWWDYVSEFDKRCGNMDYFNNPDCVNDVYHHSHVDGDLIERCMQNSGGLEKDATNSFLESELKAQTDLGVVIMPTAFVNKVAIRGAMSVANVFQAVCAGFAAGSRPHICTMCSHCGDPAACVHHGHCTAHMGGGFMHESLPKGSVSTHSFYGWMLFIVGCFSVAAAWHYKKSRDDMRQQVRTILADYMPLNDSDQMGGSPGGGMQMPAFGGNAQMAVSSMMGMGSSQQSQAPPSAPQYNPGSLL